MLKYAALPLLAALVACSADVDNGQSTEASAVDTLSVNNLVITETNAVGSNVAETEPTPVQRAETPRSAAETPAARSSRSDPQASTQSAPKPPAEADAETEAPEPTCTPEHREMGHC